MNQYRELFLKALPLDNNPALCLSGGVDSSTVLAGFLSRGIKPHCYTFKLGNYISRDFKVAKKIINHFNLPHTEITIPHNDETLMNDLKILFNEVTIKKSYIQCCHPFLYIFKLLKQDGFDHVYTGFFGDDLYGTSKEPYMAYSREGDYGFKKKREEEYYKKDNATLQIINMGSRRGIQVITPFLNTDLASYLLNLKLSEINKPFQKAVAVNAFPEFWKQGSWYRTNEPLQVCSGIREWHDTLLNSSYNDCNAKNILKVYNRMAQKWI